MVVGIAGGMFVVSAQTPGASGESADGAVKLLRYDRALVETVARQVVDSEGDRLRNQDNPYAYEEAIKKAFEELYKNKKTVKASETEISAKTDERKDLEAKINNLGAEIRMAGDTIAQLTDTTATATEDPILKEKMMELETLTATLNEQLSSISTLREDSIRAAAALASAQEGYDSLNKEVSDLNGELTALRGDEGVKRMSDVRAVADRVEEGAKMCEQPLEKVDIAALERVMSDYTATRDLLADSDPAVAKSAAKNAEVINQTILLAAPVQKAVTLMAGKYNAASNAEALAAIKALAAGAPKSRKAEINAVAADLEDQDRAFRNLNFLLNQVVDECGDSGADKYDIDAKIKTVVSYYSKDAKYPDRYVTFNSTLQKLADTMRGRKMNGAEVKHIIEELKKEI